MIKKSIEAMLKIAKQTIKNVFMIIPDVAFLAFGVRKMVALFFSLKVWFFLTATWLVVHNYINGANWVAFNTVLIGARLGNQLMYEYKNGNHSSKKTAAAAVQPSETISVDDGI